MPLSSQELKKIACLAYLEMEEDDSSVLIQEINSIMDFVDQLRAVDTQGIEPLSHPFNAQQRLRVDQITEEECLAELEAMAPLFEDHLYLVPKVLESDN